MDITSNASIVAQSDETASVLKQLKNETSSDLTALEKKGLDLKTNHQEFVKAEALPRPTRPPLWGDQFRACQSGVRSDKQSHKRGESKLWFASSHLEHDPCTVELKAPMSVP